MEQLYQTIEQYTHIAPENQILITSYGNIVKPDNLQQVLQATGEVRKMIVKLCETLTIIIIRMNTLYFVIIENGYHKNLLKCLIC